MKNRKAIEMTEAQMRMIACVALRSALKTLGQPAAGTPEVQSMLAMLDKAITDRRDNAITLALGLILANAGAWEATRISDGQPSASKMFDLIRSDTGGEVARA